MYYHIRLSNNKKIVDAIKQSGINTEYKPRFEVLIDGKIIGGSTYDLVSNTYLFDIGILEEYQGMGIAKDLMKKIIQDAKELGVEKISTYVVNERFAQYLNSIGFSIYEEEATMYIMQQYKTIASFNGDVKIYDGKLGYENLLKLTHEMPKNIEHIEVLHNDSDFGDFYSWSNKIVENNFGSNFKEGFPIVNFLKDGSEVEVITAYGELENGVSILFDKDNLEWVVEAEGGLLAPNGKQSNLTPEQYKLVRTPQFKAFFGDWENDQANASKVVDSNGEPLVVYHGTYDVFDFDKADLGFHFGTYEQAKERSQTKMYVEGYRSIIKPYFLNIRKLVDIHDVGEWEYPQRYIDTLISEDLITEKEAKQNGFYDIYYRDDNKLVREFLINKFGNIGFYYENKIESKGLSYLVLQPNQIKLADGSNTFDMNNPDIIFAKGGEIAEHEETYKKWKSLVNMSKSELENFYNSKEGKEAGLSSSKANQLGIHSGRESARWIMKMKDTPHKEWTPTMWEWANRQISFISRMSGNKGGLYDDKGNKTRKHTSLLIWGHNPKYASGGTISQTPASKEDKVYGSKVNAKGSSKDTKSAKEIKFDAKTLLSINDKVKEHNKQYPNKKITLASAKAVVRRGMGAYSSTHRPTISGGKPNSRVAWGLARLNAFMYKIIHGKSKSGKYKQDDDLINELGYSVKSYEDGGSLELLAPNGKPSNLTLEQYKLVRTPQFKAWFGDWENDPANASKVVDENGEPLVVYHGTTKGKFNIFKIDSANPYSFFAENYEYATKYSMNDYIVGKPKVYECFLNIRTLFDSSGWKFWNFSPIIDKYIIEQIEKDKKNGIITKEIDLKIRNSLKEFIQPQNVSGQSILWHIFRNDGMGYNDYLKKYNKDFSDKNKNKKREWLKNFLEGFGYNGFSQYENIYGEEVKNYERESKKNPYYASKVYAVFYPNQIKLADGTNTTFDGNNPDIRYAEGGLIAPNGKPSNLTPEQYSIVRTPEFKAWFGDWENAPENASKVVDSNGEPLVVYHGSKNEFYVFDKKRIGENYIESKQGGFFFTQKKRSAENYAELHSKMKSKGFVYECFLNIKNPIIRNTNSEYYSPADRYDISRNEYISEIRLNKTLDGIIIFGTKKDNLYVVNKPNQIKLADGSNTTFDADNADIRYEQGGIFNDKELLAKWKKGESIGFTAVAHLKAKGLIPRADGTKRKSEKYMDNGGLIEKLRAEEQEEYHNMSNPKDEIKRKEIYDKYDKLITPLMENGGQKLIQLPDVQSSEDTLKRVLDMQGYTLDKKSSLFKPYKTIEQIAEEKNVPLQYANKQLQKGIEVESEHSDSLDVQKIIALQHLDEMIDYYDKLEIMEKKYKDGGVVVGKRHSESDENGSGEKFLVKSTGQVVELEGGEGVLSAKSMQSDKMYTFDGKRMSGREVASYLNHKYGGVEFAKGGEVGHVCGCKQYYHGGELPTATVDELEGGEAVITVKTMESKNKYNFNGSKLTPRQILSQINVESGGKKFEEGGILDLKKYKLEMTHKLAKMVYFAENLLHLK